MNKDQSYATPQEVAEYLHTSVKKLSNDRYLGTGLPYVKYGRKILYPWDAVNDYMAANLIIHEGAA